MENRVFYVKYLDNRAVPQTIERVPALVIKSKKDNIQQELLPVSSQRTLAPKEEKHLKLVLS
jgi:hypothetical protein